MSENRQYWRSVEELAESPDFLARVKREAPRLFDQLSAVDRRRALQLLAAPLALAGLAGCGPESQPRQMLPYVRQPDDLVPALDRVFATAYVENGYGSGVFITHQTGRPIKVEGNPAHPATLGASSAILQASILGLYDPSRSQSIVGDGQITDWDVFVGSLTQRRRAIASNGGAGLRILTGALTSPFFAAQMGQLQKSFPGMRWSHWEALNDDARIAADQRAFGRPLGRTYDLTKAEVVVGVESDLISSTPGWLAYARQFAARRRPQEDQGKMSRVYAVESTPTLLGAKADHRLALSTGDIARMMRRLAAELGAGPSEWKQAVGPHEDFVQAVVADLQAAKGRALVHVGREQPADVHLVADLINHQLDAFGATTTLIEPVEAAPGAKQDSLAQLCDEMHAGKVDTLLILGANPVYDAPADLGFAEALKRVPYSVAMNRHDDETMRAASWRIPAAHDYEVWSDVRAFDGTISLMQPQTLPLYGGHAPSELLAVLIQPLGSPYDQLRTFWRGRPEARAQSDFETFWGEALRAGRIESTQAATVTATPNANVAGTLAPVPADRPIEILFRPDEALRDGRYAENAWLLEMPRTFTRLTWDNAALIDPATAKRLGLALGDRVDISAGGQRIRAPVYVLPGQAANCVTLPLGWGRSHAGLGSGAGFDAYRLRTKAAPWRLEGAELRKADGSYRLATTQSQDRVLGRDLIREATLDDFVKNPDSVRVREDDLSLYPAFSYPDRAWGMSIDLNSCIGCQACVIACQSENNIPVVGKNQVLDERVMHWLRIDRYYSGPLESPDVAFEPMPCMHCENAPCEVVCPVHATVHDHEGLNLMVYNRCVGTRFCSNNCPYKVRRFNFFAYSEADARPPESWNPEVTVRDRGVMEKCTYCIQRIRTTEIVADREDRGIKDGEVRTACQQACPTQAIVFGDQNDPKSAVAKRKSEPTDYVLLDDLNTRPRTSYSLLIRNRNRKLAGEPS